jgi:hypothetical protein
MPVESHKGKSMQTLLNGATASNARVAVVPKASAQAIYPHM